MLVAVKVRVLVMLVLAGLNEAVTPLGSPDAAKTTVPENPFASLTLIVLAALAPPTAMLTLPFEAERLKPTEGAAVTVRPMVVVLVSDPDVPFTVTV